MFGMKAPPPRLAQDEAEKPFWISFSDLMTSLMVLFLVAMSVALMAVTQKVISGPEEHRKKIDACMADVRAMTEADFRGVQVMGHSVRFGSLAEFELNDHRLDEDAKETLRSYVPKVLRLARSDHCKAVFKRVIVEGFASKSGGYIHNLNLSLQRAERVLCVLLDPSAKDPLTDEDRRFVRSLFLVGGRSFNDLKGGATDKENQRIELKLEFLDYSPDPPPPADTSTWNEPLDLTISCPIDRANGSVSVRSSAAR
jgi:hypothetical protein